MCEILKISLTAFMFSAIAQKKGSILNWYFKLIERLPEWLSRPLGSCYMCFTGQVCLWYYLIWHWKDYDFINHAFFVSAGIFASMIYNKIYCYLNGNIN